MAPPRGSHRAAGPAIFALLKFLDFYLRTAVCVLLFARRADYLNSTFRTAEAVAEARYLSSLANNISP